MLIGGFRGENGMDRVDIMDQTEKKRFLPTKSTKSTKSLRSIPSISRTNNKAAPGYPERPSVFPEKAAAMPLLRHLNLL